MLKYHIFEHKHFKVIFDIEKYLKNNFENSRECYVKRFELEISDNEINEYIDEKLNGNVEFKLSECQIH